MKTIVMILMLCGEPAGVVMRVDGQWMVGTPRQAISQFHEEIINADEKINVEMAPLLGGQCA